jgi:hypothetical protein
MESPMLVDETALGARFTAPFLVLSRRGLCGTAIAGAVSNRTDEIAGGGVTG